MHWSLYSDIRLLWHWLILNRLLVFRKSVHRLPRLLWDSLQMTPIRVGDSKHLMNQNCLLWHLTHTPNGVIVSNKSCTLFHWHILCQFNRYPLWNSPAPEGVCRGALDAGLLDGRVCNRWMDLEIQKRGGVVNNGDVVYLIAQSTIQFG